MSFAQPNFPRKTGVLDRGQRRRTGTTVVAADGDDIRARFGNAGGNDADARTGNEFYADARARIHGAQVMDQLRQVFDAVNVVMRRRRNQRRARGGVPDSRDVFADFLRGQLAALTRFRTLRHFDFELFGVDEVIGGDSKTPRGDLLDLIGRGRLETIGMGIFAAFAGITAATELIHRQSQGPVRFRAERAKRHRLGAETLDDGLERLDLVQSNSRVRNGVEQVPQKDRALQFGQLFKRRVGLRSGRADMSVKPANNLGRTGVKFRALPEAVKTGIGQFIGFAGKRRFMQTEIIGEEIVQRFLTGIISSVFKNFGTELLGETHDLKKMAVAIAGQRGDAHTGENFSQARIDGRADFFRSARFKGFRKLIGKIGHNGAGASRHKKRDMMRVKNLRGFDNQRHIRQSFANHGFPDRRRRKQRRQRRAAGIDRAIGKEEEPRASAAAQRGSRKLSKTAARPRDSSGGRKSNIDALFGSKNRGELRQLPLRNYRTRQRGEKRGRRVIPHAPVGFFSAGQRGKKNLELIFGPAGSASDTLWLIDRTRRRGDG